MKHPSWSLPTRFFKAFVEEYALYLFERREYVHAAKHYTELQALSESTSLMHDYHYALCQINATLDEEKETLEYHTHDQDHGPHYHRLKTTIASHDIEKFILLMSEWQPFIHPLIWRCTLDRIVSFK